MEFLRDGEIINAFKVYFLMFYLQKDSDYFAQMTFKDKFLKVKERFEKAGNGFIFNENDYDWYQKMLKIVDLMISVNNFLVSTDEYIDTFDESKSTLEIKDDGTYINRGKRQYIKDIRNAIAHSNYPNENYKISADLKRIYIKSDNNGDYDIILPIEEFDKLRNELLNCSNAPIFGLSFNLPSEVVGNIKRYGLISFMKFLSDEDLKNIIDKTSFSRFGGVTGKTMSFAKAKKICDKTSKEESPNFLNGEYAERQYFLNNIQKKELIRQIKMLYQDIQNVQVPITNSNKECLDAFIVFFYSKTLPIATVKNKMYDYEREYAKFAKDWEKSNQDFVDLQAKKNFLYNSMWRESSDLFRRHGNNEAGVIFEGLYYRDLSMRTGVISSLYFSHLLSTLIPSNTRELTIGTQTIKCNKLRNSFVHRRWGMTHLNEIYICDWSRGKERECNPNNEIVVDFFELCKAIINESDKAIKDFGIEFKGDKEHEEHEEQEEK